MRIVPASLILLVSCTCGAPATTTGSGPTTPPTSGTTGYEVHEWGLVRAGPGDVLEAGAVGPGVTIMPMVAEKPVLYFHVTGGPIDLSVARVEAVQGEIREHWPLAAPPVGAADPAVVSWAPLTLRAGTCALSVPAARAEACAHLHVEEACESLSLARTVSADADCVETASGPSPLLFYRSTTRGLTVPLRARMNGTDVVIENAGASAPPGRIVRFSSLPGRTTITIAAPPAPGASVTIGEGDEGPDAARAAITASMTELGLTAGEAAAFLASWDAELFPAETPPPAEEEAMERMPAPVITLLYFLPASDAEHVSHLTFEPAPTAVRRAMAVWTGVHL
jgi:hypothetical protein